ncbi:MAG: GAF domain-containing protein, partial [Chloroflexota bacterium]
EEFPAWRQLSSPMVMAINDVEDEHNDLDVLERMSVQSLDVQSFAVLPLRVPGRSIGVIFIGSEDTYEYSEREIRVLQAFAEQASLTLEAKRLLEQTEQRAKQLQTSAVISQSVSQILDLDELLPLVVDLIQRQFNYDHVQVFLMDENNEWADLKASTGEAGQNLLAVNHRLKRGSESVIGQVTELGEPTIALDTADAEVTHQPNPYLPETRSEMALPMVVKGAIVGALDVQSNTPNAFTDEDIQVLTTLASQIAVAIDNANLYEETERNAADMEFLFNITREAAAAPTLEDALQYVAERVQENIGGDLVAIYLPQAYEDYYGNRKVMVEIEAVTHNPEQ